MKILQENIAHCIIIYRYNKNIILKSSLINFSKEHDHFRPLNVEDNVYREEMIKSGGFIIKE